MTYYHVNFSEGVKSMNRLKSLMAEQIESILDRRSYYKH